MPALLLGQYRVPGDISLYYGRHSSGDTVMPVFLHGILVQFRRHDRILRKMLPAAITWYFGASSAKYFKEVSALSHIWISSNMINV